MLIGTEVKETLAVTLYLQQGSLIPGREEMISVEISCCGFVGSRL